MRKRKWRKAIGATVAIALMTAGLLAVLAPAAQAQDQTGASATKDCPPAVPPAFYTIGDTVVCTGTFTNDGAFPATVTSLTETAPFISTGDPGNGAPSNISCTLPDTTVVQAGGTLPSGTVCTSTINVTIPNDPALCNTVFRDRVDIALEYQQFTPPLEAGAFATHTFLVVCRPTISVTKTADTFSKVGDPVDYSITVCNTGLITVTKESVIDSLIGDITAQFAAATLAPGACDTANPTRTVLAGDPDPLVNTATATYTAGVQSATASATASTDLFVPGVDVTKTCVPSTVQVGENEVCTIVVTDTSSSDAPALHNGTIVDTLNGDLLDPTNTAVTASTCTATLPHLGSCTITTERAVQAGDPNPLSNTVTVHYNPTGFPNDITDNATATVEIVTPTIKVTKTATTLSKVGDDVTYTIEICNTGPVSVNRTSVIDTLLGNISGSFDATLAPGACSPATLMRTVMAGDPDPLLNTVTAVYAGIGASAMAQASASTNLFQPGVHVTKTCAPSQIQVGQDEICTIHIINTSSADAPSLANGTVNDSLTGNLLDPSNTAVTTSNCAAVLPTGADCTIVTHRKVLASDPNPLVNTVTVLYHPDGFPNNITDTASAQVQTRSNQIFQVELRRCTKLHVGYNYFPAGTVVRWNVSQNKVVVAHGQFTTLGGGKDYHFLTQSLGVALQPFPDAHVHFHWTINNVDFSYTAIRKPFDPRKSPTGCSPADSA